MTLHQEFVKLSFDIFKMKNRLISLLLEIYEKKIFKEHGCATIYEYGFKYAKLSRETVDKALRTLKHVENKPFLKKAIEKCGIHKVALVATIATPETDKVFAEHVQNMSKPALFEFAKEIRHNQTETFEMIKPCHAANNNLKIELDQEMQILFFQLKQKLEKEQKRDFTNKEALKLILAKAKTSTVIPKSVPGNGIEKQVEASKQSQSYAVVSRHIPTKQKQKLLQKHNNHCAYPNCTKPVENIHHRVPYAFNQSHETIIPLCKIHHEFAHNGVIQHELWEPSKWQLSLAGNKSIFDNLYLENKPS